MTYRSHFDWDRVLEQRAEAPEATRISETFRQSRKDRPCFQCGQTIRQGETYRREFWIVDGDPTTYISHPDPDCWEYVDLGQDAEPLDTGVAFEIVGTRWYDPRTDTYTKERPE
jgi:hypothetical protein